MGERKERADPLWWMCYCLELNASADVNHFTRISSQIIFFGPTLSNCNHVGHCSCAAILLLPGLTYLAFSRASRDEPSPKSVEAEAELS